MKAFWIYLLLINALTFMIYGLDKRRAVKTRRRISERSLIALAVIGGSPGALAAMSIFRHKTRHKKFTLGVPIILLLQLAAAVYVYYAHLG